MTGSSSRSSRGKSGHARVLAPAKVNLRLDVLGRRPDGYHELRTWIAALALADVVDVERVEGRGQVELRVTGPAASPDVPADGTNLAVRAASAVLASARDTGRAGPETGLRIDLEKHVPSQAGLGGGSSDAAAAWLGAEVALGVELPAGRRRAGLASLGSDCVFFMDAMETGLALCEGRGERVAPAPAPSAPWHVAVVVPEPRASTGSVYAALENRLWGPRETHSLPRDAFGTRASDARRWMANDLEEPALSAVPELVPWRVALDEAVREGPPGSGSGGERFLLSGSGSAFYAVFDDAATARRTLDAALRAARSRGLEERGHWLTSLSGFGLRFLSES